MYTNKEIMEALDKCYDHDPQVYVEDYRVLGYHQDHITTIEVEIIVETGDPKKGSLSVCETIGLPIGIQCAYTTLNDWVEDRLPTSEELWGEA